MAAAVDRYLQGLDVEDAAAKTGRIVREFYLVPRIAGDPVRGPEGASRLNPSSWATRPGSRSAAARPGRRIRSSGSAHFKLVPRDWHEWDVASTPALIHTAGGKRLLSAAPKDGDLHAIDLTENAERALLDQD
jgi:alcohol dehydrogenase (cytochrome c)